LLAASQKPKQETRHQPLQKTVKNIEACNVRIMQGKGCWNMAEGNNSQCQVQQLDLLMQVIAAAKPFDSACLLQLSPC
jgi:hypothetical protein